MKIAELKLEVVRFASEDVIATSAGPLTGMNGLFYIPTNSYGGTYSGSGNYVEFSGTFGQLGGSGYEITGINGAKAGVDGDREGLMSSNGTYFPELGITIPNTAMAPIAQQAYDAFSYGNGQYYTNGVSYYDQYWQ